MTAPCVPVIKNNIEEIQARLPRTFKAKAFMHSSEQMPQLDDESVHLVVTSPPYPMVEQWDDFGTYSEQHEVIETVLSECYDKLVDGGVACINIGDATRTMSGKFRYYPNHSHVHTIAEDIGFDPLIPILWKKPTNKPNSFMGSGMKPPNAYVTNEVEYILIFRKGFPRKFEDDDLLRRASQYTQEQRNEWFSQIWEIPGAPQGDGKAQFPFEVPYRLIRMFSVLGDTVLDPFTGTGTTLKAARCLGRHSVGYEVNDNLEDLIINKLDTVSDIDTFEILENQIRSDRDGVDSDIFYKNPTPLIDII